jgi:hypothetical protein
MNLMALNGVEGEGWVGAHAEGGNIEGDSNGWKWSDETEMSYWPVAEAQEARGCSTLMVEDAKIHADECDVEKHFVCKRPVGGKAPAQIPGT